MRARTAPGPLVVGATGGIDIVMLGFDLDPALTDGLQGFAIRRTDRATGKRVWLQNLLAYEGNADDRTSGYSSRTNPIQTFRWGDYTARSGHDYSYLVRALAGAPATLRTVAEATIDISTEPADAGTHRIVFNKGVIASQAYAQRFGNKQPADIPDRAAYRWLSSGLEEALLAFIAQADGPDWALRAAVYEFDHAPVLDAFAAAAAAGADVTIVSDTVGPAGHEPKTSNAIAIGAAGIEALMRPRTHISIAHNKFIVALHVGVPVAVWTGSTNITEGGIFGQSNVGHAVHDPAVAARFLDYWNQLSGNPFQRIIKPWNDENPTVPKDPVPTGSVPVFSPRSTQAALQWYADLADRASTGVFLTAAFGISAPMLAVLTKDRDYLKYVLLDTDTGQTQLTIRDSDPDNQVAVGNVIGKGGWGRWVREVTLDANKHVRFVHTKYLLIDPLGADPIVVTGSANFSKASTISNDENMLVIRGDTRVADIYLTEFMSLFTHYEFRASIVESAAVDPAPAVGGRSAAEGARATAAVSRGRRYLDPTSSWVPRWYAAGSSRAKERKLFARTA